MGSWGLLEVGGSPWKLGRRCQTILPGWCFNHFQHGMLSTFATDSLALSSFSLSPNYPLQGNTDCKVLFPLALILENCLRSPPDSAPASFRVRSDQGWGFGLCTAAGNFCLCRGERQHCFSRLGIGYFYLFLVYVHGYSKNGWTASGT